jgi:MoaA/NifB/PqqE/SkfB family radical SAM enzyme
MKDLKIDRENEIMLNPFDRIYSKINKISASFGPLPEYPLLIDIEQTSRCNLQCVMCEHTYMNREKHDMPIDVFKDIIDQSVPYKPGIRFIMYSEPFLVKDIIERCRYVKKQGLLLHLTTNGTVMEKSQIDQLLDTDIDSVIFSFQGSTREEYAFIRQAGDKYDKLTENIEYMRRRRDMLGREKPFMQVSTTVTQRDKKEDIEKFREKWSQVVDRVTIGITSWSRIVDYCPDIYDRMGIENDIEKRKYLPCQDVLTKLAVFSSGDITVCCSDAEGRLKVGNIGKDKIKDIWHSELYKGIRLILKNMRMDMLDLCKNCYPAYDFRKI